MIVNNNCKLPTSIDLELTESCNLRCKMCYLWGETGCFSNATVGKKPISMDFELVKRIIRELTPAKPRYSLFGGEPLMYPYLEETIRAIKEAGSVVDTPTNGTLLTKNADMLVRTGFDSIRVSLDGSREINDSQRGKGSHDKAMDGIEALHYAKQKAKKDKPVISIIYTITQKNYLSIEDFFLRDLDLSAINWITIQMQNFLTKEMGIAYARMLETEFGLTSDSYWKALVRTPEDFAEINTVELARQVNEVCKRLQSLGKNILLLPPTFSSKNLTAYMNAKWHEMTDTYFSCPIPWHAVDITASGDLAPCHIFYDLIMGNLYDHSFEEIWNGNKYQTFRKYMEQHHLISICPGCCILYLWGKKTRRKKKKR